MTNNNTSPRVDLIIVEGKSEETILDRFFKKIYATYEPNIKVQLIKLLHRKKGEWMDNKILTQDIYGGDIFTEFHGTKLSIQQKIYQYCIEPYINRSHLVNFSDIRNIFIITDSDGTFISNNNIVIDTGKFKDKFQFKKNIIGQDKIYVPSEDAAKKLRFSHKIKQKEIKDIQTSQTVSFDNRNIPVAVYYMSVNIDHVCHNDANITGNGAKVDLAFNFILKHPTMEDIDNFLSPLYTKYPFEQSWDNLKQSTNSLMRETNINCFKKSFEEKISNNVVNDIPS